MLSNSTTSLNIELYCWTYIVSFKSMFGQRTGEETRQIVWIYKILPFFPVTSTNSFSILSFPAIGLEGRSHGRLTLPFGQWSSCSPGFDPRLGQLRLLTVTSRGITCLQLSWWERRTSNKRWTARTQLSVWGNFFVNFCNQTNQFS